jgi:hypothetical protein
MPFPYEKAQALGFDAADAAYGSVAGILTATAFLIDAILSNRRNKKHQLRSPECE